MKLKHKNEQTEITKLSNYNNSPILKLNSYHIETSEVMS